MEWEYPSMMLVVGRVNNTFDYVQYPPDLTDAIFDSLELQRPLLKRKVQ
jgi:hypothetical protein